MAITRYFTTSVPSPRRTSVSVSSGIPIVNETGATVNIYGSADCAARPGYKSKIEAGVQAGQGYSCNKYRLKSVLPGLMHAQYRTVDQNGRPIDYIVSDFSGFVTRIPATVAHMSTSPTIARSMALTKILKKIEEGYQHMQTMSVLAELGDIIRQFRRPFKGVVDLTNGHLDRLAKARRGGTSGSGLSVRSDAYRKIVADSYLEWSFGLSPLISDTESLAEAFARYNSPDILRDRKSVRARGRDRTHSVSAGSVAIGGGDLYSTGIQTVKITSESRSQFTVGLDATITADFRPAGNLSELLGFNFQNFVPAAWEVVPWSWLIDYFSNVGAILNGAVTNTTRVTWIVESASQQTTHHSVARMDWERSRKAALQGVVALHTHSGDNLGSFALIRTTLVRTLPQTLGVPDFYLRLPTKLGQLGNLAALVVSRSAEGAGRGPRGSSPPRKQPPFVFGNQDYVP